VFQYGARRTGCHQNKNIQIFKEQFLVRTKTKNPRRFLYLGSCVLNLDGFSYPFQPSQNPTTLPIKPLFSHFGER
jgi:hypothetical protein